MGYDKNSSATPGSYGHAIMTLAQGLDIAVTNKWVTQAEAKYEFRSNVRTLVATRAKKREAAALRAQADELEGVDDFDV